VNKLGNPGILAADLVQRDIDFILAQAFLGLVLACHRLPGVRSGVIEQYENKMGALFLPEEDYENLGTPVVDDKYLPKSNIDIPMPKVVKPKEKALSKFDFHPAVRTQMRTPWGHLHMTIVLDNKGNAYEIFAQLGKSGDVIHADLEGLCRMASMYLKKGGTIREIIDQWDGIGSVTMMPSEDGKIVSLPDALSKILQKFENKYNIMSNNISATDTRIFNDYAETCPECKAGKLYFQEGCLYCVCGFSQC